MAVRPFNLCRNWVRFLKNLEAAPPPALPVQYGMLWLMTIQPKLDPNAEAPLYKQLFEQIAQQIRSGQLAQGERIPPTRELAGQLGLNRTTISAAYEMLETEGLVSGHVGRGSFVTGGAVART